MSNQPAYWSSAVSDVDANNVFIRGFDLGEIIGKLSFPTVTFLLIRGRLPTPGESKMTDAVLCSVLDYALRKPGTAAARFCVSSNPSMVAGLATAVLSAGEYSLAPDQTGNFLQSTLPQLAEGESLDDAAGRLVAQMRASKQRVPGFGHPVFRFTDPRAQQLKAIAIETGVWGELCDWYEAVHRAFTEQAGKPEIVINEVGMMGAILAQMGFTPQEMTGLAVISTMPGVVAHISEELQSKVRIRVIPDDSVDYARERHSLNDELAKAGW
ncbi:citryl-CoA lyase [Pseudomonas sp. ZM23]|uniref:citrate synthase (unknown stereospecificity) n=1 Tax=Pseudomonas triclosanedens TaxID=2961893 RepID=A0ABY7A6E4_9PSED|nr:citryl-CoA lyase [Pseudomonas triclosanedens]MCP8465061.1 citryl-CoA lyase [Pseudomonas triclosanedens]MCP8470227.1 citryl-CoA lyase [Pseudomonas triclosanedens]MCP8476032.1 citryl-CoA lyase [Pseudomonas triclosanedens]WAI51730.1 citryl-CoA lyase [Pseudomonas triclosanedens]